MADPHDISILEVYRVVMALRTDVKEGRIESREAHERLRDDLTDQQLKVREGEVRLDNYMERIQALEEAPHKDVAARWASFGSFIGAIVATVMGAIHK